MTLAPILHPLPTLYTNIIAKTYLLIVISQNNQYPLEDRMFLNKLIKTTALLLISLFLITPVSFGGFALPESDTDDKELFSFFELRDRESFVQVTNVDSIDGTVHVQIFDVSNNCNENNFFDTYTAADTHVYNMRDIQTNNGNPSGVVLPDGAYGFVSVITVNPNTGNFTDAFYIIGNFRIIDETGYEYRTNSVDPIGGNCCWGFGDNNFTFNFNTKGNITLSDVVGIAYRLDDEVTAADITDRYLAVDIDILNENEVIFSCRNVIFACTDQNNPLL